MQVDAELANNLRELLNVVLDEVDLGVVIFLHTVKLASILIAYLINILVDQFNVASVLLFSLPRGGIHLAKILFQSRVNKRCLMVLLLRVLRFTANLSLEMRQLNPQVHVGLLGEEHFSPRMMQALPNFVGLLKQDTIGCCVVLAVLVGRFDQLTEQ